MGKLERDYLFPEIQPYDNGMLDVGDGNRVFWETCGNPSGKPALVLHGGPGSGCTPWWRRLFDPDAYRVVLFDQRGCGRSTPNAGTATADLTANTTLHLLKDIELLRRHLEIDQWLVLGGSWGSTLGLAYAQQHAELVSEMVLFSVVTTSKREVRWITRDIGRMFPAAWERFRDGVPLEERDGSLVDAYAVRTDVWELVLSLPVIGYSSLIFFRGAYAALRARTLLGVFCFRLALGLVHVREQSGEMVRVGCGSPVPAGASGPGFLGPGVEGAVLDDRTDVEHADVDAFVGHFGV